MIKAAVEEINTRWRPSRRRSAPSSSTSATSTARRTRSTPCASCRPSAGSSPPSGQHRARGQAAHRRLGHAAGAGAAAGGHRRCAVHGVQARLRLLPGPAEQAAGAQHGQRGAQPPDGHGHRSRAPCRRSLQGAFVSEYNPPRRHEQHGHQRARPSRTAMRASPSCRHGADAGAADPDRQLHDAAGHPYAGRRGDGAARHADSKNASRPRSSSAAMAGAAGRCWSWRGRCSRRPWRRPWT